MLRDEALEWFAFICTKPMAYVQSTRYEAVCAFLNGYCAGLDGGPLLGFREWLLTGMDDWNNLPWWALVQVRARRDVNLAEPPSESEDEQLLGELASSLQAFARDFKAGGMPRIYYRYCRWVLSLGTPASAPVREQLLREGP